MPHVDEWVRCEPNDPKRCQASGQHGQCPYKAKEGSTRCIRHDSLGSKLAAQKAADMYKLGTYQQRTAEFTTSSEIKNLRAELGILRMTLEKVILSCKTDMELTAYSGKISDMAVKIQALLKTCHRLEKDMGMMLDRDTMILIGQRIVDIISKRVDDPAILDALNEEIVHAILSIAENQGE